MPSRPTTYLNWTDGSPTKVTQPPSQQLLSGWTEGEPIPFQYLNWLFWLTDEWVQYLDNQLNNDVSVFNLDQTMRLINGGTWSWNLGTSTLAWSSAFNLAIPSIPDSNNQVAAGNAVLSDGQVAYVAANVPFTTTGNTTNGSNVVTNLAFETGIVVGQTVTGTGIPNSTTVSTISGNTVTLSQNATATNTGVNLTFSGVAGLTVSVATSSSLLPSPNTVIIARRVGSVVYVGVNASQMLMHDAEQRVLMEFGYVGVYQGTAGENLTAGQAVYISPGTGVDSGRTTGRLYKTDVGTTNGAVRSAFIGFVVTTVTTGNAATVVTEGLATNQTGLTLGLPYYLDPATPGGVTATKPTTSGQYVVPAGMAVSTTVLQINSALGGSASVVSTPNAWPNFFATTEAEFSTAISSAISAGGGVICLMNSFTCTSSHTIPANTIVQGRVGASIITLSGSGAIVLSNDNSMIRDVQFTTALTSGALVTCSGNYAQIRSCQFTIPTNSTGECILVTGNSNKFYNNIFIGVQGADTGYGIVYQSGSNNSDADSVFLP